MNTVNFAFIRLALFFVAGILAGFFIEISLPFLWLSLGILFSGFLFFFRRAEKLFLQDAFFGISCFLLFFALGILSTRLHLPENQKDHYINLLPAENPQEEASLLVQVREELKPSLYQYRFTAEVKKINGQSSRGKILLTTKNDSAGSPLKVDDLLILSTSLAPISPPLNPHQFDYAAFMANRGILRQARLDPATYRILESGSSTLAGMASDWRNSIVAELEKEGFRKQELAIIQALLLGQRQDIPEEIYEDFAAAGVIHILAVSGLHVGIILFLLHWLFAPLERSRHGRFLKTLLLILCLWIFAVIAGLSPSVVRAVSMFSFVAVGLQIKRRSSTINTLFMSMVALLLIRPQFLFEVGFQLSYLAVFSIVLLQPIIFSLYDPPNKALKYLWGLAAVTLAAQAGVLPLSLFYFHQFPGLFFISNLVVLPFMGLLLGLGIIVMALALLGILPGFLATAYAFMIRSLNDFVQLVAEQERFLISDIPFSAVQTLGFYLLLAALILMFSSFTYKRIVIALTSVVLLQLTFYYEYFDRNSDEFVVFHKTRYTLIGHRQNSHLLLGHNLPGDPEKEYAIRDYVVGEKVKKTEASRNSSVYRVEEDILLLIDSTAVSKGLTIRPRYLLLTNSPQVNLTRIIRELQPQVIIADGSNYLSYIDRWQNTCRSEKVRFHHTGTQGAFVVRKSRNRFTYRIRI